MAELRDQDLENVAALGSEMEQGVAGDDFTSQSGKSILLAVSLETYWQLTQGMMGFDGRRCLLGGAWQQLCRARLVEANSDGVSVAHSMRPRTAEACGFRFIAFNTSCLACQTSHFGLGSDHAGPLRPRCRVDLILNKCHDGMGKGNKHGEGSRKKQ